ncbi:unnamed protein product [Porites lobata]|uniref:CUB domain-containing protein n=1 Tax=Porites lobata TaxID=104759 RepID=A0ABN8QPB8_9CNID|nr:unnamed protein product [Porites lobata]
MANSQSARVPFLNWGNDSPLEHQEQNPPPGPLNCSSCAAFSEQSCIAMQTVEQCPAPSPGQEDLVCFTQQASDSKTNQTFFTRGCILPSLCDLVCSSFNNSRGGAIESCSTVCCNTRLCNNAGSLPTTQAPTTMVPSTTVQPTTPLACGGQLTGKSGTFKSPNFPNNYPNNVTCVWTIIPPNRTVLSIAFFQLGCGDFVEIFVGGRLERRLTGRMLRMKCSRFGDEGEQLSNDEDLNDLISGIDGYDDIGDDNRDYDDEDTDRNIDDEQSEVYNQDDTDANDNDDNNDVYNENDVEDEENDQLENGEYLADANPWSGRKWRRMRGSRRRLRRLRRRLQVLRIRGGQEVRIVFSSNGNGTMRGFKASYVVRRK